MKEVAIGVDIGGTFTKYGIVDKAGNCLIDGTISTTENKDIDGFLTNLKEVIDGAIAKISEPIEVKGLGLGAPNGNFYKGTIEYAPNLSREGVVPFVELFKKHYDLPMFLTNDANAAAIGEMVYGGAKDMNNFIIITLGTGLGSGLVVNGELVYGHDGFAGELGHLTIVRNGRMCPTGRRGSLETYASASGIKRTIFELLADSIEDSEFRDVTFNQLTAKMISDAALKGDKIALEAFELAGKYLGEALADSVAHTSPEAIFLFGGLANAGELIFEPTKRHMELNLLKIFQNKVKILPSELTETNAAVMGASALVW
ncbi:MAG: ROK family protein, partial [Cyclobacteriaceae bacterium]|nr:ROK family protein [Cyclobacteriaceae bacterium]